jgi:hypothetical protein
MFFIKTKKNFFFLYNLRSDQISIIDDLAFDMYQDPEIGAIIKNLDRKKQECVHGKKNSIKISIHFPSSLDEKFEQARRFKQAIQELIKVNLFYLFIYVFFLI